MLELKPLFGLRPAPAHAAKVASLPYDVVTHAEVVELTKNNPSSFLNVTRSEVTLPAGTDPHSTEVYEQAKKNLNSFINDGLLIKENNPSLYIYRLEVNGHSQTGVMGGSAVAQYKSGIIKTHEKTRPDKVEDRLQHMLAIKAQPGPVFLAFRSNSEIKTLIDNETKETPLYNFVAEDGVRHTFWQVKATDKFVSAFAKLPCSYIADGHHRAASSSTCQETMAAANSKHNGSEQYNSFLSVLFPHDELRILPYNRIIKSSSKSAQQILSEIGTRFNVEKTNADSPKQKGTFCMYLAGEWYQLIPKENFATASDPVENLDVSILYRTVLAPVFGIGDQRVDKNIDFIGGIRGSAELKRAVDAGEAVCAFSLFSVSMDELLTIADQGLIMAPKSTWFEPKLRSGLFVPLLT